MLPLAQLVERPAKEGYPFNSGMALIEGGALIRAHSILMKEGILL